MEVWAGLLNGPWKTWLESLILDEGGPTSRKACQGRGSLSQGPSMVLLNWAEGCAGCFCTLFV